MLVIDQWMEEFGFNEVLPESTLSMHKMLEKIGSAFQEIFGEKLPGPIPEINLEEVQKTFKEEVLKKFTEEELIEHILTKKKLTELMKEMKELQLAPIHKQLDDTIGKWEKH